MLLAYEVDPVRRIATVTLTGDLVDEDFVEIYDRLRSDRILEPDFALLLDLRQARGTNITASGVHTLARLPLLFSPRSRRAVVVPSSLGFAMARMYQFWRGEEGRSVRIFRDFDEAKDWVGSDGK
jgi:hypothetical protein